MEKSKFPVNWRMLFSLGFAFWGILCYTDLLGESSWKKCSYTLDDILKGQYMEITRKFHHTNAEPDQGPRKMNWSILLWNICAFLCSLVFCSVMRSMSWIVWKLVKVYKVFRNRKDLTNKMAENSAESAKSNCKVLFENQLVANKSSNTDQAESKEIEELRQERKELCQQLSLAQKENLTARQQIEEYKLETYMMKEKLARTANSLRENMKYKDFATSSQEMVSRKIQNLELHLKEVSRDRDLLRSKLGNLEKHYSKLEEKLKFYEKQDSETNIEQFPEKDIGNIKPLITEHTGKASEPRIEISNFQRKIMELQKSIGTFEGEKIAFEANSKISVDLEESSMDTSKENDGEQLTDHSDSKKAEINIVKQNILNYNAYKAQMMRPKLSNIKERLGSGTDTTGSSSDENSGPQRIISSTVEFQNFLKTLSAQNSTLNFKSNVF